MQEPYFVQFENRKPYSAKKDSALRTMVFQCSSILTLITGFIYFYWRWRYSINYDHIIFSLTLLFAEMLSFFGICLLIFELWKNKDHEKYPVPHLLSEIQDLNGQPDRPIRIDIFIATINEDLELLRYTIKDAKALHYSYSDVAVNIYLLDDGRRDGRDPMKENLQDLCKAEGILYLTRENNIGFKAGNLKNGLENSSGDLFVILDADTRPFPSFLENTFGYFRKKQVAWVQTCHWFYDTTPSMPLSDYFISTFNIRSKAMKKILDLFFKHFKTGGDIYGSDPRSFYEVIQRRRNNHNSSFCCGAASIHRRKAVMETAINQREKTIAERLSKAIKKNKVRTEAEKEMLRAEISASVEITPFIYHISEDLYTSMIIHSDEKKWESVLHPHVECKMLSPQDVGVYVKQRARYAAGSIDIFFRDNPLFKKGLSFSQRVCYFHSVWSYLSCLWIMIFLACPIFFFYTNIVPVNVTASDFFYYFIPFYIITRVNDMAGSWGVSQKRGKQYYISLFWINFTALLRTLVGTKVLFTVTPKTKQEVHPFRYVWPHLFIIGLTLFGIILNIFYLTTGRTENWPLFLINTFWGLNNCYALSVFVRAAYWNSDTVTASKKIIFEQKQTEMAVAA